MKFSVGSRVIVARKIEIGEGQMLELGDWHNTWAGYDPEESDEDHSMDAYIGRKGVIMHFHTEKDQNFGVEIAFDGEDYLFGHGYGFPLTALELVDE